MSGSQTLVSLVVAVLCGCGDSGGAQGDAAVEVVGNAPDAELGVDASPVDAGASVDAMTTCPVAGGEFDIPGFGIGSATCDACMKESCCLEYQDAESGLDNLPELQQCASEECASCIYSVCDSNMDLIFLSGCASCLGANCCEAYKDCGNDSTCFACLTGQLDPQSSTCLSSVAFESFAICRASACFDNEACGAVL